MAHYALGLRAEVDASHLSRRSPPGEGRTPMLFQPFVRPLRSRFQLWSGERRPRGRRPERKPRTRPTLEALESRVVLDAAGIGNGVSQTDFGSIVPIVNQTGLISLSLDGLGTTASTGTIQVEKP